MTMPARLVELAALHASIQHEARHGDESCPAFHAERLELTGAKPQARHPRLSAGLGHYEKCRMCHS